MKARKNTDDKWRFNPKKTTRTADLVAAVATTVEEDLLIRAQSLVKTFDMSAGTIFNIIHNILGLIKKSTRWVPKLLSPDQVEQRVETSAALIQLAQDMERGILSRIIMMDESAVSMHTP